MEKNRTRLLGVLLCLTFTLGVLTGCGGTGNPVNLGGSGNDTVERETPLRIVTTIFPVYDWVRQILGDSADSVELTFLLDSGVDMHSFQPSMKDIMKISDCDLFVYVGGESDRWVEDAVKEAANQKMIALNLLEALGADAKEEAIVEGMEDHPHTDPEEPGDGIEYTDPEEPGEGIAYDEHIWLSLKNAQALCAVIADVLSDLDPEGADRYRENLDAYTAKLSALDACYEEVVREAPVRTLLFADRFPFRYLTDDYDLDYYAAFSGCSAETGASFETIVFLANKVDALRLPVVLTIETGDGKMARTVVENTAAKNAQILTMDSMQSITGKDVASGRTYLGCMERNLEVLREALQ